LEKYQPAAEKEISKKVENKIEALKNMVLPTFLWVA